MAKTEHPKGGEGVRESTPTGAGTPYTPLSAQRQGEAKHPRAPQRVRKVRRPSKVKNYLLFYERGKYRLINLSLKKKGHEQKY